MAATNGPAAVTVQIGGAGETFHISGGHGPVHYFELPFDGRTGAVSLSMSGRIVQGPEITSATPASGHVSCALSLCRPFAQEPTFKGLGQLQLGCHPAVRPESRGHGGLKANEPDRAGQGLLSMSYKRGNRDASVKRLYFIETVSVWR